MKLTHAYEPHTILVATSLDDHPSLMPIAMSQARQSGAGLLLVHVMPTNPDEKNAAPGTVNLADPIRSRKTHERLRIMAVRLQWQGIVCDPLVLSGEPAEQIAAIAQMKSVSSVIVGARIAAADGQPRRLSVAEALLPRLRVPALVIGPRMTAYFAADAANGRILLPLSLRHQRSKYIEFANRFAVETCSRVALLHVLDTSGLTLRQREQARDKARIHLAALAASEANPVFPMELLIREGDVVRAIVEEAICPHRDFILMGAGSLSRDPDAHGIVHRVIAEARCPVIALHSSAGDEIEVTDISTTSVA